MLESNTEAKQATGTGSKLGPGVGGCAGKGSEVRGQAALWAHNHGSGVLPSPRQERLALESLLKAQGTGDKEVTGIPRMARGEQEPRPWPPSPSSPSHSIKHIADSHLGAYTGGWGGRRGARRLRFSVGRRARGEGERGSQGKEQRPWNSTPGTAVNGRKDKAQESPPSPARGDDSSNWST